MGENDKTAAAEADKAPGQQILGEKRNEALRGEPPSGIARFVSAPMIGALKDASIAAGIAGALFVFFIGQKTDLVTIGLSLRSRWGAFFLAVAIVFAGRLAINLLFSKRYRIVEFDRPATIGKSVGRSVAARFGGMSRHVGSIALAMAVLYPLVQLLGFPQKDK